MTADRTAVAAALESLLELAPAARQDRVVELSTRLHEGRLRVLVAGEAKRGKSTLVNRILGRDLLPTGALPVTATATTVRVGVGDDDHLEVRFADGRRERQPLDRLACYVTEDENPGNRRGVVDVSLVVASAADGIPEVELIDTPGTGSVFEHNTAAARRAYEDLDAVIVVVGADPPVSASETALLTEVAGLAVRTFVVVNKTDQLDPSDLERTVRFTEAVVSEAGVDARVWPISTRGDAAGLADFLAILRSYLRDKGDQDVLRAVAGHAARLTAALRDETNLTLAASRSTSAEHRDRVRRFQTRIDVLAEIPTQLRDTVDVAGRRILRELTADADAVTPALVAAARQAAAETFDREAGSGPAEREDAGRAHAVEVTVTGAETWRDRWADDLQSRVVTLTQHLDRDIEHKVGDVRADAQNLLGVELSLPADAVELYSDRPFWFATDAPMRWELPGASLARYHGPGAARRARRRLIEEVGPLAAQQIGRARADLQQRLAETTRKLTTQLATVLGELAAQLGDALRQAKRLSSFDASAAADERDRLTGREAVLAILYAQLNEFRSASTASERRPPAP